MSLEAGTTLGPYEIIEQAGAGGMGEVYKAKDTRLDRTVAIKVLPATFALNDDIKQRFEREAKTISSLNHPNICTLYDVGEQDGLDYLVMEFIEGETLSEKIKQGPIPMKQFLEISIQIADALDKAHRQGLIHRDLKPGNIMLTRTGAKLLDFGLAKLSLENSAPGVHSITQTTPLTGVGTLLGTMQYMAPEQLEGAEADTRSDIFAFGAVMYEMATGVRAFRGSSQATLIASIIKDEPKSVSEIAPQLPPLLEQTISQCIDKDPEQRWQSVGDLKRSLQWIADGKVGSHSHGLIPRNRSTRETIIMIGMTCFFLATVAVSYFYWQLSTEPKLVIKSHIHAPEGTDFDEYAGGSFALSPDGTKLAFVSVDTSTLKSQLWVRPLSSLQAYPIPNTENVMLPFWSPDSKYIAFFTTDKLKKVLATGGPTQTICDAPSGRSGDWNRNDIILFSPTFSSTIHKVAAAGGESVPVTELDTAKGDITHRWVRFLPDGNHFLFYARTSTSGSGENDAICLGSLDSDKFERIIPATSTVEYANGHILYQRETSLMAHPFDASSLKLTGDAFPIIENVTYANAWSRSIFTASQNGVLLYRSGEINEGSQLLLFDREGNILDSLGENALQGGFDLSPDEQFIVQTITDQSISNTDLWIHDIDRAIKTRLTFDSTADIAPIWSPDGTQIAFRSNRDNKKAIYIKNVSGLGETRLLYESEFQSFPSSWSRDGANIFTTVMNDENKPDAWVIPLEDGKEPYPFLNKPYGEWDPAISPDGKWLAYTSFETGKEQVYVTSFPEHGSKWQVSNNEGDRPRWSDDGRELYYLDNSDHINVAEVDGSSGTMRIGKVKKLFEVVGQRPGNVFDVNGTGQRFVVNQSTNKLAVSRVILVNNWNQEFKK